MLTQEALDEMTSHMPIRFVEDGEQLLAYLRRDPPFQDKGKYPAPGIILLDLNMPRLDGREALRAIKSDPLLRVIPVIILTTSQDQEDIQRSYDLGVNSYITKPSSYPELVQIMSTIRSYWLEIVQLPEISCYGD